ncbi:antibiotic biosynthesis monooxygenase [Hydrococcus rivularis NIES-593]|uniref:Antibiotic biosynthesis monooxygenase n=1 Tax=Hydrococcus rivularis NIES-593 TaxID=1921803 RepID=A0A1U7H8V0_9CYAN|nr:putative quinol monooxygenase [Hydrococcus rivularis]OKH19849.1 antibiotic biosynthesis monooxygenase [Hydrococcus rivularis NIES-593]
MSNSTIRVVARVIALPDKIEELKAVLLQIVEPTRQEEGCIQYDLFQNQTDPTDFTFVEEWTTKEALDKHLASEHLQAAVQRIDGLVATNPDIRTYHQLN